jgi:hypothetical protein
VSIDRKTTFELESICTWYPRTYFKMSTKSKQKFGAYMAILYVCTPSFTESTFLVSYVKKIHKCLVKRFFKAPNLSFYTRHKKCRFSAKLL